MMKRYLKEKDEFKEFLICQRHETTLRDWNGSLQQHQQQYRVISDLKEWNQLWANIIDDNKAPANG